MTEPPHLQPTRDQRVVTSLDRAGNIVVRVENVQGREFVTGVSSIGEYVSGYVVDSRMMFETLGSCKMPSPWFMTWMKILSLQRLGAAGGNVKGYIKTTQRDLQNRCGLSAASINEAMQFFSSLPWIRPVKRGLYQANPYLTAAGSSGEHQQWQDEWVAAVGDTFILPAPDHATRWREEHQARLRAAKELKAEKKSSEAATKNIVPIVSPRHAGGSREPRRAAGA